MARRGRTMPLRRSDAGSTPPEVLAKGRWGSAPGGSAGPGLASRHGLAGPVGAGEARALTTPPCR